CKTIARHVERRSGLSIRIKIFDATEPICRPQIWGRRFVQQIVNIAQYVVVPLFKHACDIAAIHKWRAVLDMHAEIDQLLRHALPHAISAAVSTAGCADAFIAPTAMIAATATSMRPYAFALSSLRLPAGSRAPTALEKHQRNSGWPPCRMRPASAN